MSRNRHLLAANLIAISFVTGCVSYDATDDESIHSLAGQCYKTVNESVLSEYYSFVTAYIIQKAGANRCTPLDSDFEMPPEKEGFLNGPPVCSYKPVRMVPPGTEFVIDSVTDQAFGSTGRCYTLDATMKGVGIDQEKVRIPSCNLWSSEWPYWLIRYTHQEVTYKPFKPLAINSVYAVPCDQPAH